MRVALLDEHPPRGFEDVGAGALRLALAPRRRGSAGTVIGWQRLPGTPPGIGQALGLRGFLQASFSDIAAA